MMDEDLELLIHEAGRKCDWSHVMIGLGSLIQA